MAILDAIDETFYSFRSKSTLYDDYENGIEKSWALHYEKLILLYKLGQINNGRKNIIRFLYIITIHPDRMFINNENRNTA